MNKLVLIALVIAASACQQDNKNLERKIDDLAKSQAKLIEMVARGGGGAGAAAKGQQREEPAPDAVFAVDVAPDVKKGQVEGSANALVTIVEAWDFA